MRSAWISLAGLFLIGFAVLWNGWLRGPAPRSVTIDLVEAPKRSAVKTAVTPSEAKPKPGSKESALVTGDEAAPAGSDADATEANDAYRPLREWRAWAKKAPDAALAAALKLPPGAERNEVLGAICLGLGETQPRKAADLALALHLNKEPGAIVESLVQQWASADTEEALAWSSKLPAGSERDQCLSRIAFVESQQNPSAAANLVIDQIPPGSTQDEAVISVLHQWAMRDTTSAANWVATFPNGPLRKRALDEIDGIVQSGGAIH